MRIEIVTRNYEATDKLKEVISKKITKFDKYFEDETSCKVCLKKESKDCKMEITLEYKGTVIRAEVAGENFYDDLDYIIPKIEKQIYRHRSKLEKKLKSNAFKDSFDEAAEPFVPSPVVRKKQFALKPMSTADAIEELELVGHSFYVFLDDKTNKVMVVYLREDGGYGLIEPMIY